MSIDPPAGNLAGFAERPFFRVLAYYVFLFASVAILIRLVPGSLDLINAPLPASSFLSGNIGRESVDQVVTGEAAEPWRVVLSAVVALASACIMMLPVTWVYVQTRRKKGFQQSVVQTLIILP